MSRLNSATVEMRFTRDHFIGYEWICCTIRKR
jgi:hypothetical protein